jgi:hypothetical protein
MIDRELAAFLEEGLVVHLGTRNARLEPNGARVTAVAVDADGSHVTAYVPKVAAGRILRDLDDNGLAALVFVRPTDDRACQVKGVLAGSRPATRRERAALSSQWDRAREGLARVGVPRVLSDAWTIWPSVALRVRVTDLFNQTPGPGAGGPLR